MNTTILLAVAPLAAAGAVLGLAGTAGAATPPSAQILDRDVYSIQETITNNTDVDRTYVPEESFGSNTGGHWQQQPLDTLRAHTSEVVTACGNNAIMVEDMRVTSTLPNGDHAIAWPEVGAVSPERLPPRGVYTTDRNFDTLAETDPHHPSSYSISGGAHVNATFTASQCV